MKLLLIILTGIFVISCNKDTAIDTLAVTLPVATNVAPVRQLTSVPAEDRKWTTASFYSTELGFTFTAKFKPFFNDNNPNGYVIIYTFMVGDKEYRVNTYAIGDDERYIALIHGNEFMINSISMLGNKSLTELFRTAEALAITYYETGKTNPDENTVWKYGRSMIGRTYGVPASFKLK